MESFLDCGQQAPQLDNFIKWYCNTIGKALAYGIFTIVEIWQPFPDSFICEIWGDVMKIGSYYIRIFFVGREAFGFRVIFTWRDDWIIFIVLFIYLSEVEKILFVLQLAIQPWRVSRRQKNFDDSCITIRIHDYEIFNLVVAKFYFVWTSTNSTLTRNDGRLPGGMQGQHFKAVIKMNLNIF